MEENDKIDNKQPQRLELSRKVLTQIGEKLYGFPDVELISIQVEFKDGSGIRFRKMEEEDNE